jgi:ABC-type multidrug transport system ATPase subunit
VARRSALCSLSFEVPTGAVTALVGANGSGKSTLLRLLIGAARRRRPVCVEVLGHARTARGTDVMRRIGLSTCRRSLWPELSVAENLAYRASLRGVPTDRRQYRGRARARALRALREFAARRPASLSAGERQRALLAATLVHGPELLLLDEPSTALDILAQGHLHTLLEEAPRDGRSVLIATHHLEEVWMLAPELLVLNAGRLLYAGPTRALAATHFPSCVDRLAPCSRRPPRARPDPFRGSLRVAAAHQPAAFFLLGARGHTISAPHRLGFVTLLLARECAGSAEARPIWHQTPRSSCSISGRPPRALALRGRARHRPPRSSAAEREGPRSDLDAEWPPVSLARSAARPPANSP